jgi:hypothetical protein
MIKSAYWKIEQLPGVSSQEVAQLRSVNILNTQILLEQTQTQEMKIALAARLGLSLPNVNKWYVLADLARIPSIGCYYCGLLLHIGVISIPQLIESHADRLHQQILRLQVATMQRKDLCPPVDLVQQWIREGRSLLISHEKSNNAL